MNRTTSSPTPTRRPKIAANVLRQCSQLLKACPLLSLLLLALAGCQHADLADRATQERLASLRRPIQVWGRTEQARPQHLNRTLTHAAWYFKHQREGLARNLPAAGQYFERDVRRSRERLPRGGQKTRELLYGKPEQIEYTAIMLFY
ncbi:MAG: hypothetical protein KAY37_04645 [Phycisphaerae bacterium]|nr:hypothetical protein [Phycisphaerae bacterium]